MGNYISMSQVISGREYKDKKGWVNMRKAKREKALETIKHWLLYTCNFNSQVYKAINRMSINNLPGSCGIMNRLTTDGYIAGQDYPSELRYVKKLIKKEC